MPNHKISPDLKFAALRLYQHELLPFLDILDCLGLSWHTFYHVQKLLHGTGDVVKPHSAFYG
ncbi:hypothetical protein JVU11DRAFT_7016 [Chiua virens]|nr:hypothetical protein JVU11DRAFT_7016 [Chiua virens]